MLNLIKKLILNGKYDITDKADAEMKLSGISKEDVLETIIHARKIDKAMRSTSPGRTHKNEKVYIICGFSYYGIPIYTKGTIKLFNNQPILYRLISAKKERIN